MNPLICPITQEPIVDAVMTCVGSIYESSAITEWLRDHHTDPLTNLTLPISEIYRLPEAILQDFQEVRKRQLRIKELTLKNYPFTAPTLKPHLLASFIADLAKVKARGFWQVYSTLRLVEFEKGLHTTRFSAHKSLALRFARSYDLGVSAEFLLGFVGIDLSSLSGQIFSKINYKGVSFAGADLTGLSFVDCEFSRCSFLKARIRNVQFENCSFVGEEVCFTQAISNLSTIFIDCKMEKYTTMSRLKGHEIEPELKERGLWGEFTVFST